MDNIMFFLKGLTVFYVFVNTKTLFMEKRLAALIVVGVWLRSLWGRLNQLFRAACSSSRAGALLLNFVIDSLRKIHPRVHQPLNSMRYTGHSVASPSCFEKSPLWSPECGNTAASWPAQEAIEATPAGAACRGSGARPRVESRESFGLWLSRTRKASHAEVYLRETGKGEHGQASGLHSA